MRRQLGTELGAASDGEGGRHPEVVEAVCRAASDSTSFGACCPAEVELAEEVKGVFPSMELLRFVSSGTEAVMTALRVARGFTGRDLVVKFEGSAGETATAVG